MAFKVFICHSTADMGLVYQLKHWLEVNGIEAYVALLYPQPGMPVAEKITQAINSCDCFLVLLTRDGARSEWVNQEIALAVAAQRPVVPIVEIGVQVKGLIADRDYVPLDPSHPELAINWTVRHINQMSLSKEAQQKTAATVLLLLGLLAVAAAASRHEEETLWR